MKTWLREPRREAVFILLALWIAIAWWVRPLQNANDVWMHLACARSLLAHHHIPRADYFSWTMRGHPWIDHEWLFQLMLYGFYQGLGVNGIILQKIIFLLLTFFFVWRRLRPLSMGWRWGTITLILLAGRHGWNARADLVTLLGVSFLLWALDEQFRFRRSLPLLMSPVIFFLWANMHGGFLAGLIILTLYLVGALSENRPETGKLLVCFAGCLGASCLTPYGLRLLPSLLKGVGALQAGFISEWQRTPWAPMKLFWAAVMLYWLFFLVRPHWRWRTFLSPDGLVGLVLTASAIRSVRHTPLFLIACLPAAAGWATQWCAAHPRITLRWNEKRTAFATLLCLAVCSLLALRLTAEAKAGTASQSMPIQACQFIEQLPLATPVYNDYGFGSFWLWYFGERRADFIDGRLHTVDGFMELYAAIERAHQKTPAEWNAFLNAWRVEAAWVAFPSKSPYPAPFYDFFPRAQWALVYWDDAGAVFLKRSPKLNALIKANEFRQIEPEASPGWLRNRLQNSPLRRADLRAELKRSGQLHPGSLRVRFWQHFAQSLPMD